MAMPKAAKTSSVGAAEFRARCLELVDHVRKSHAEYVVTRHGVPVAKLGPVDGVPQVTFLGSMAGSVLVYDRPFDPVPGVWSVAAGSARDDG